MILTLGSSNYQINMKKYNFRKKEWKNDVIESFQWSPSKCDTVLKCDDGQVYMSMITLVVASRFWRKIFSDLRIQPERTVILLPSFKKDTVQDILEFLKKGELKTECYPSIIDFTKALVPEIDIEKIKESVKVELSDEDFENDKDTESDEDPDNDEDVKNDDNIFKGVEIGKTTEQRHACKFCLKFFSRKTNLNRHIQNMHFQKEINICPFCNKKLASKEGLKAHMKTHEENRGNYVCLKCGKKYTNPSELDKHCNRLGHDFLDSPSKKPTEHFNTKCEICHKWVGRLEFHMKEHHSERSKTFSCDQCDFKTNRKDTLYKHKKVSHDQYYRNFEAIKETLKSKKSWTCIDCGVKFETSADIEQHIALEGCKDNKCQDCGKTFNVRHNLLQHIREVHEVTQQFKCQFCNKMFNQKRGRDRHEQICKKRE